MGRVNKVSQEKRRLNLAKIGFDRERREENRKEERKLRKEEYVDKKKHSFYAKGSNIKIVYFSDMPIILLVFKEVYFNTNKLNHCIVSVCVLYCRIMRIFFLMRYLVGMSSGLSS